MRFALGSERPETDRRQQRLRVAMRSGWQEIPRSRLKFGRHGQVEDEADGKFYAVYRGEVDAQFCAAVAYYVDEAGDVVFLERPAGPRSRDELEAKRAEREQARAERLRPRARR